MFQSLQLLPWTQRLKNQVFKKYLVFLSEHGFVHVTLIIISCTQPYLLQDIHR